MVGLYTITQKIMCKLCRLRQEVTIAQKKDVRGKREEVGRARRGERRKEKERENGREEREREDETEDTRSRIGALRDDSAAKLGNHPEQKNHKQEP
ncbi:hypothetical protein Y696_02490 [Mesotoga sp. H07pep.5.4]|nr:hypothetical protein Y696_02490 [Mesotoga sp. H07pep.5.4]